MSAKTKVLTFDFNFRYTRAGILDESSAIVLCEPSYTHQRTFHQMRAWCTMAEKGMISWLANVQNTMDRNSDPDAKVKPDDSQQPSALDTLRYGLTAEKYIEFVEFVQRELTGKKALAWVGSDDGAELAQRFELNAGVWQSIGENGGMDAIEKVISGFADFFLGPRTPKASSETETAVGLILPPVPVSTQKEPAPLRKR